MPDVVTDDEPAKLHFHVGAEPHALAEHHARGEYAKAVVEFHAAYDVVPRPALHRDLTR